MTVTFCGHSDFSFKDSDKEKLKDLLIKLVVKFPTCKFYLGGYGNFDALCFSTLKEIKKDFSGYLVDPLQIFKWKGKGTQPFYMEKSLIRPTFSYMGNYTISDNVFKTIIEYS